ncbi:MAG: hypothetical protein ABI615_11465 [Chthoniobacterales bacterium]
MKTLNSILELKTQGKGTYEITEEVARAVKHSGVTRYSEELI